MIEDMANGKEIHNSKDKLADFTVSLRVLRLMHYLLFQVEYLHSGQPGINANHSMFPLAQKKVSSIIEELATRYNLYEINYEIKIAGDIDSVDRIPTTGSINNVNPELYDVILILWNVMQNAAVVAVGQGATKVQVDLSERNGRLNVNVTNLGKIRQEFYEFINNVRTEYPTSNANPNKRYRGLEIVKDKCQSHNRKWKFQAAVSEGSDNLWYTNISITL